MSVRIRPCEPTYAGNDEIVLAVDPRAGPPNSWRPAPLRWRIAQEEEHTLDKRAVASSILAPPTSVMRT